MDTEAEKQKLKEAQAVVAQWDDHPVTQNVERQSKETQEALVSIICEQKITDVETFFAHFEAVGHLRGLRQAQAFAIAAKDEMIEQMKELQQ